MSIKVNGHDAEPGCYVDGHWGQYGPDRVETIAQLFEYEPDPEDSVAHWRLIAEADEDAGLFDGSAWEAHVWAADKAEEWLNDHTEGGYWEWYDGEFFLVADGDSDWLGEP